MRSVALIGPDGTGKSTIAHEVAQRLSVPARYLYMGVNLESSSLMLPTTRLMLELKRRRRTANRTVMTAGLDRPQRGNGPKRLATETYSLARLLAWLAEEWYRAAVARVHNLRGQLVVFDRHFLYDYYHADVQPRRGRSLASRLHGLVLWRAYPRPDFVVCLDAPADVLHARKGEQPVAWLDARRREYLALASLGPEFAVVPTDRQLDEVVAHVCQLIEDRL